MKEFLWYIHTQLSRIALLHKSSETLSKEDNDLFESIRQTVTFLVMYAEESKNGKLYQIADDFEYSVYHMRVTFKAESALEEAKIRISKYPG
ncbi:MAG TPA: hypothetical protein VJ821_08335 [Anaerolineales bacterium]|nr:hypothetical protein [Anaerolineales bacterium]